ncbi:MAG: ABC transporter substrate-binding protein [Flavobacteriales bacterium]|nr:ABC transporter substrate-binding protein [Flavobacteriales bacterium]
MAFLLATCRSPDPPREREGAGGRYYGGVFNVNESEELRGLFPLSLAQAVSHRIAAQIYEGLVRLDPADLTIRPALASSWTVDPTGTVYTFQLREGVRFHDDPCFPGGEGRPLTARDVVHCFTAICSQDAMNQMFWLFQGRVLGADEHFAATERGEKPSHVAGIEALDERTVRITLKSTWPGFLQVLAHQGCWIWPRELVDHHGKDALWNPVGTGAFRLKHFTRREAMILERWPHYWGRDEYGNALPFLDAVRYTFVQDKHRELEAFEAGKLSMVFELPVDRTDALEQTERYQVQSIPGLTVQFYGFNTRRAPFQDVRVRQAFAMAIDRDLLVDSVLDGLAVAARHGVVPPGFADYPYDSIPPASFDPERARALLAEAGYPQGQGLPTVFLQVNHSGFGYVRVAEAVQAMLEQHLRARVVSTVLPADQHFERVEQGLAQFWREGWIADHPDPENFLSLFHGINVPEDSLQPSYLNSTRFRDAAFDALFGQALHTPDRATRLGLLAAAESRLMEEQVVVPLYHERSVRLLQPWVRDMPINGMEVRDLARVWFDPAARSAR